MVLEICLAIGVLPEVNEKIYTDLPDLQEWIPETFPTCYSFTWTQVSDVSGLYAFKLLVEDLIGLMGCFHPSPKRRKIPFRLSMNLCEICVVFFCVDGKAVWVLGSLPCSYIHSILFMPRYGGGMKAIVYFRLKILCYNIYMFGCCFYIGMGRNFSFSLPGSKNIFWLKLSFLVKSKVLKITDDKVAMIWFL